MGMVTSGSDVMECGVNILITSCRGVNIKYVVFSILYRHINVPMAYKKLVRMLILT